MPQPRQAFFAPTAIHQSLPLEWRTPSSLPLEGFAVLSDTPVACQTSGPTRRETGAPISRRRQPPPTHCGASRRNGRDLIIAKNDQRTSPYPRCCQRQRRRGYFAPRRERFLCLRRPHFFQQREKWGKERRQKLRFCTSSARYACSLPPAFSLT